MVLATNRLKQKGLGEAVAIEEELREVLLRVGAGLFASLLDLAHVEIPGDELVFGEKRRNQQPRMFQTLFGPLKVKRTVYYRYETGTHRAPFDQALGVVDGCTPALLKLVCRSAARGPYAEAASDLAAFSAIHLNPKRIHRAVQTAGPRFSETLHADTGVTDPPPERLYIEADGTGIPLRKELLRGRKGKQEDGSAKTHEVKVGCVFTQSPRPGVEPLRDPDSTSYIATMKRTGDFGPMLLREARRRNLGASSESVFISDGAAWLREIARTHFPNAIRIIDYYHASEHLHELAGALHPDDEEKAKQRAKCWEEWILENRLDEILHEARSLAGDKTRKSIEEKLPYFEDNADAMRYGTFRQAGIFIGSGVVEASCKTVVGKRMKHSGAFWSQPGATHVLDFRAALASGRFDSTWETIMANAA
jgi:hypothetical protein